MPNPIIARRVLLRSPVVVVSASAEVSQFLARTTGLDGTHTTAYTTLIDGIVADGNWSKLDALYIRATDTETNADQNLKSSSYTLTKQGTVTHAADAGSTGNGSTGYFTTGYTPSTAGGAMTLNSTSIGVYIRNNRTTPGNLTPICAADATQITYISPLEGAGSAAWDCNGTVFPSTSSATAQGAWVASRTASNSNNLYKNGSSTPVGTNSSAPAALVTQPFVIGAYNNNGSIIFHSTDQIAAAFWGSGLTGAECVAVNNRINAYLTTFGTNVY